MTYLVNTNGDVFVALSTDGGSSFTKVADLQTKFGDQPSIAVGPNSVWVSFTRSPGNQIQAFGAPVTGLGQFGSFSTPENVPSPGNGDYGDTAVGPAGQVMVTYQNAVNGQGGADIYTAVDPDGLGPAGFGKPTVVAHSHVGGFDFIPAQPNRSIDAEANLAWDRSGGAHNGRVYLVWTQETPNESDNTDIMLQRSDNNGATWSPAIKLNDDLTTNSQYDPAIALDQSSGNVAVSWYDTRNDLGTGGSGDTDGIRNDDFQIWATDSTNGGATFAPNFQVSEGTSNAVDANSFFDVGDLHARRVRVRHVLAGLVGQLEQHGRQPGRDSAPVRPLHGEGVHPVGPTHGFSDLTRVTGRTIAAAMGVSAAKRVGAQNAFAADFHSRRRCAMSSARSSSLPPSSTWRSEGSARR
jgi:hypothetical protein